MLKSDFFALLGVSIELVVVTGGCLKDDVGQPCVFERPKKDDGTIDCKAYPSCVPLQDKLKPMIATPRNDKCPEFCFSRPSFACESFYCIATQVTGNNTNMNGVCYPLAPADRGGCTEEMIGCKGYCSKECLSDASCPKGFSCSLAAPYDDLKCDDPANCTPTCKRSGETSPDDPSFVCPTQDNLKEECKKAAASRCCDCICSEFCDLRTTRICIRDSWDSRKEMFGAAIYKGETVCKD